MAHINCLWLSLHVFSFTASFLRLTAALLSSQMACDTHLSQANLCVPSCQVKQLCILLTSNPISLDVCFFPCFFMYKSDHSFKYSIIKFSALLAETFRVYFIPACTDSRNTFLAAAAGAMCILTRWPYVAP